jgi:phage-related protein
MNKNKRQIDQTLNKIDREYNLTMAKLNKVHQDFFNFIKEHREVKDKERLNKLRKDILNK